MYATYLSLAVLPGSRPIMYGGQHMRCTTRPKCAILECMTTQSGLATVRVE